jgi:hypothetical protein
VSPLLDETRRSLGSAPRSVAVRDNLPPPGWMRADDPLRRTYAGHGDLLLNGDVIWGHIVQANTALFRAGNEAAPAQVVYAASADEDVPLDRLRRAAGAASALKGRKAVDPAVDRIAAALAAENDRHDPLDLPAAVTHGSAMRMAIVVVHREHLPSGLLSSFAVPLLASRGRDAVVVLPRRHWSADLVRGWCGLAATGR